MMKNPAVRMLVWLGLGYPLGRILSAPIPFLIHLIAAIAVLTIVGIALRLDSANPHGAKTSNAPQPRYRSGFLLILSLILSGFFIGVREKDSTWISSCTGELAFNSILNGRIVQVLEPFNSTSRYIVDGTIVSPGLPKHRTRVLLRVYGTKQQCLSIGDAVCVMANIRPLVRVPDSISPDETFRYARYHVLWIASAFSSQMSLTGYGSASARSVHSLRTNVHHVIDTIFGNEFQQLAKGLLVNDASGIDPDSRDSFSRSGTAHLLAVSGSHISMLAFVTSVALLSILSPWLRFAIMTLAIVLYTVLCGGEASVMRAGGMIVITEFIRTSGRLVRNYNVLSALVIILVSINPEMIQSIGFQLSIAGVSGIQLLYKQCSIRLRNLIPSERRVVAFVIDSIALSLSASCFITPVVAWHFHSISIVSPLANIVAVPLCGAATAGVAISTIAGVVSLDAGCVLARGSEVLMYVCMAWIDLMSEIPGACITQPYAFSLSIWITLFIAFVFTSANRRQFIRRAGMSLLFFIAYERHVSHTSSHLEARTTLHRAEHKQTNTSTEFVVAPKIESRYQSKTELKVQPKTESTSVRSSILCYSLSRRTYLVQSNLKGINADESIARHLPLYLGLLTRGDCDTLVLCCSDNPGVRRAVHNFEGATILTIGTL